MSRFGVFTINGTPYDLDDLTLDEMETFEEIAGGAMDEINFASAKTLRAVATIFLRRTNPTITAEAIGAVKLINFMPPDEEVPATGPPAEEAAASENGSEVAAAGVPASVESIAG